VIGNIADRSFGITNSGTDKLIISDFNMTNPRFEISPNFSPDTINPNQTKNYTVKFTPTVFDTTSGQLRITSNDAVTPVKIVNLYGKGVYNGSHISTSVASVNYNSRRINSLSGGYITIINKGTTIMNITGITTNSQRFRFDTTACDISYILIDSQKTKLIRVWFNPNAASAFSDTLNIISNAGNTTNFKIPLNGTGVKQCNYSG
jgi:hypothetical protein